MALLERGFVLFRKVYWMVMIPLLVLGCIWALWLYAYTDLTWGEIGEYMRWEFMLNGNCPPVLLGYEEFIAIRLMENERGGPGNVEGLPRIVCEMRDAGLL